MRGGNNNPTGKGGAKPGEVRNPSGRGRDDLRWRELIHAQLRSDAMLAAWVRGYQAALEAGEPPILKDYADRMAGKVKEFLDVTSDGAAVSTGVEPAERTLLLDGLREWMAAREGKPP